MIGGPLLALTLMSLVGVRTAMLLLIRPGVLAAAAIVYVIRQARLPEVTEHKRLRIRVRPVLRGQLGRVLAGFAAFEMSIVAATLLILRATDLLAPERGIDAAAQLAIVLYVVYNIAATVASFPAGGIFDRLGRQGPLLVTATGSCVPARLPAVRGVGPGARAARGGVGAGRGRDRARGDRRARRGGRVRPEEIRGSAFGLLATVQAVVNVAANVVAGLFHTFASPAVAFGNLVVWMVLALVVLGWAARSPERSWRPGAGDLCW